MISFLSILHDSFRMLKSSVIFWITLGLSGLVAVLFLALGFDENGMTYFGFSVFEEKALAKGTIGAEMMYKTIFSYFVVGGWLSWAALILALISCASIYPQMMEEGSSGMLLTKHPGRGLVFFAKFVGGLLFMLVQVVLFVGIVFFAMYWRLGSWNPEIFWFIPATVLVFAFLNSFSILIAVWTRSALVAILLPLLLWVVSFAVEQFEQSAFTSVVARQEMIEEIGESPELLELLKDDREWHRKLKLAYAFFPKITPVIAEASKVQKLKSEETGLLPIEDKPEIDERDEELTEEERAEKKLQEEMEQGFLEGLEKEAKRGQTIAERHSASYTLGTSFLFSFVMLGIAGWIFCRRDF